MTRRLTNCALAALAPLLLFGAPHATATELGRLFFTPQQREELDRRRESNAVEPEIVVESLVTVNGQVSRSSGRTTTWINGVPQYDAYRGRDPARVVVDDAGMTAPVKIGDTLDRTRGEVRPAIEPGAIEIHADNQSKPRRGR
ncbi:MAG: hypothetical protein IT515_17570 [Burkholderiales bacterium]|nr:hypothetical protein [Burkholderiales bacterium]